MYLLVTVLVLAARSFDQRLGYEVGRRFGLKGVAVLIVVYAVAHLIFRATGGRTEEEQRDDLARRQEEAERRSSTGDGPPRFNG